MYNYKIKFGLDIDVNELKGENINIADTIVESNSDSILEKCAHSIENQYEDYAVYTTEIDNLYDNADDTLADIKSEIVLILNDYILPEFVEKVNNIIYGDDIIEFMEEQFENNLGTKVEIKRCNDIIYEITSHENISDKLDPITLEDTLAYEVTNSIIDKLYYENKELELDIDLYNITINEDYSWRIVENYQDLMEGTMELIEE